MSSQHVNVRGATMSDLETIVSFNRALAEETEDKTLEPDTILRGVRKALADASLCTYYVAETDDAVVGQTMVTVEWSDWRNGYFWWIQSVYVEVPYRRRGVFRALYDHIRDLAQRRGDVCGLRLYVVKQNTRAIETYRDLGMTLTDYLLYEEDFSTSATG